METRFLLRTREDTGTLGRALGSLLLPGDVVALIGDLGAGKTTLTQAIALGMGITEPVTSPTFTLVQEYGQDVPLFHFDPYRLENAEDVYDFGFEEYLGCGGVVVVEWADKLTTLLPNERLTITLNEDLSFVAPHELPERTLLRQESQEHHPGTERHLPQDPHSFSHSDSAGEEGGGSHHAAAEIAWEEDSPRIVSFEASGPHYEEIITRLLTLPGIETLWHAVHVDSLRRGKRRP